MSKKLSESLIFWRSDRPDEWTMDEFIRQARKLELEAENLKLDLANYEENYSIIK